MRLTVVSAIGLVFLSALSAQARATDRLVPSQYSTMQSAIDAAVNGDTVIVAPGTYNQTMTISNKAITIRSSAGASTTKIDRNGSATDVFTINNAPGAGVTIEGFTILRSQASVFVGNGASTVTLNNIRVMTGQRAVYVNLGSDFVLTDVQVAGMTGSSGGGVYLVGAGSTLTATDSSFGGCTSKCLYFDDNSSGTLINCQFMNNTDSSIYCETATVVSVADSEFNNCSAASGAAAYIQSGTFSMTNCSASNFAANSGGVVQSDSAAVTIDGLLAENAECYLSSGCGGVVGNSAGALTVRNSTFRNLTLRQGSGMTGGVIGAGNSTSNVVVENVAFENCRMPDSYQHFGSLIGVSGNRFAAIDGVRATGGAGSYAYHMGRIALDTYVTASVTNCTFDGQGGYYGVLYSRSTRPVSVTGCQFTNSTGGGLVDSGSNHALSVVGCRFQDTTSGCAIRTDYATTSLTVADSVFVTNTAGSPSQGSAIRTNGPCEVYSTVFSGNTSFALLTSSPGFFVLADCAFCGPQATEVYGAVIDKGGNHYSLDCTGDCDLDGYPDSYEIAIGLDTDCNANGIPESCDADSGGLDCNDNGIPDSCDIAGGAPDCNGDGVPDSCEADCDADGTPNACEISGGESDCNLNGIPDSCEPDCDGDGVLDVCEITSGSPDCNANTVPDSCDIALNAALDMNLDGVLDSCQPSMQFAGLQLEIVPIANRGTDDLFPASAVCYRLFATTTGAATTVIGMYGNQAHPLLLEAVGGFWQSSYGGDLASEIPCDLSSALPSAKYDSWFTIGSPCGPANVTQNGSLDLTGFNSGGAVSDSDGIIYVTPNAAQAVAGAERRVLLAQLTTTSAVFPTGFVDLVGRAGGSADSWIANHQQIPMPALVDCNSNGQHDAFDIALGTSLDCDQSGIPDTCEFPSASTDCNTNGIADLCDTISGYSADINGNHVPDECECTGDVDGNGYTNVDDLIEILVAWGDSSYGPADLNQDGTVNSVDLGLVLVGWGNCL